MYSSIVKIWIHQEDIKFNYQRPRRIRHVHYKDNNSSYHQDVLKAVSFFKISQTTTDNIMIEKLDSKHLLSCYVISHKWYRTKPKKQQNGNLSQNLHFHYEIRPTTTKSCISYIVLCNCISAEAPFDIVNSTKFLETCRSCIFWWNTFSLPGFCSRGEWKYILKNNLVQYNVSSVYLKSICLSKAKEKTKEIMRNYSCLFSVL